MASSDSVSLELRTWTGSAVPASASAAPGGVLALDYEIGEFDATTWRPRPVDATQPAEHHRRLAPDGFHYALRHLVTSFDPDMGRVRLASCRRGSGAMGELVADETHDLVVNVYTSDEIVVALSEAGFVDIRIVGGYHGGEPTADDQFHVFLATAPYTGAHMIAP